MKHVKFISYAYMKPGYLQVLWKNFDLIKTQPEAREGDYDRT